ncbi:MAG: MbnP family protein, partial [Woeseiaceae bacterium]
MSFGCSEPYFGVKIPFQANWGGETVTCADSDIKLSDLRFYVSEVQLVDTDGNTRELELHADIP